MTRPRRFPLRWLLAGLGLVAGIAGLLVFKVPPIKQQVKARWHAWKCPELPLERSTPTETPAGFVYEDPFPFCSSSTHQSANLFYDFECVQSTWFTPTTDAHSGQGVLTGHWLRSALQRRAGDVGEALVSISAGCMLKCTAASPDVRIVIRIDHPDGSLLEWNEKRLIPGEHQAGQWERFNFEWLLRELRIAPDDLISIFILTPDEEDIQVDDLRIVFRSAGIPQTRAPHA